MHKPTRDVAAGDPPLTGGPGEVEQRTRLWRLLLAFYLMDGALLGVFSWCGVLPWPVPLVFIGVAAGLFYARGYSAIRVAGRTLSGEATSSIRVAIACSLFLGIAVGWPHVGVLMFMSIISVLATSALRLTTRTIVVGSSVTGIAAIVVAWISGDRLSLPMDSFLESAATAAWFALAMMRGASVNLLGRDLRKQLALSNEQLLEALARVRELAISERKLAQDKLAHMANYDALTGLVNRTVLLERLDQAISRSFRQNMRFGVLFVDLDNFKSINDLVGHENADDLLVSIAERISVSVRADSVVARLGTDTFAVLLADVHKEEDAAVVARRLLEVVAVPCQSGEHEIHLTASVGVAIFPHDGEDGESLLRHASTAMHVTKQAGPNGFRFFTQSMGDDVAATLRLVARLRIAIRQKSFELAYQPKVDAHSHEITGIEVLIRWRDAELGVVSPERFIPVAERHGLIGAIGDWVLQTSCLQNKEWQDSGLPALPIAVNMSAIDFDDPGFPERIRHALALSGMDPAHLEIELTEGALVKDPVGATATLRQIKALGVSIAIDDFGTGYSSLAYLAAFPIDRLKIDRTFVRDLSKSSTADEITRAIIGIAKRLSMKVVAEGVETRGQANFLTQEQCDELQGYLFSKPVSPADFAALLQSGRDSGAVMLTADGMVVL